MKAGNFIIKKRPPAPHHKDIENKRSKCEPNIRMTFYYLVADRFFLPIPGVVLNLKILVKRLNSRISTNPSFVDNMRPPHVPSSETYPPPLPFPVYILHRTIPANLSPT